MRPGPRIGRYEVLDHLASGGMGQVYLARATGLGGFERQVVIKTLDPCGTYDDEDAFVTMFLDEARLVGSLHHQYIAPVHEVGCDEDGRYFLVMDYIHGQTAEAIWKASDTRSRRVPLGLALTIGSAVASALDYAHNAKATDGTPLEIVHRDVSLSNVMVGHEGSVRLIDFGIARSVRRDTRTEAGMLKGKIGYLAPEQVIHRPVDRRTDVFALGIVMYELTTSTRAFQDPSDMVTFERITRGDLAPPSKVVADYPPELESVVMRALATEPIDRYQDAGTMGRDLETVATKLGITLGHTTVCDGLATLFGGRRRSARGSGEDAKDQIAKDTDDKIETDLPMKGDATIPDVSKTEVSPAVERGTDVKADVPTSIHDQPTQAIPRVIEGELTEPAVVSVVDTGPDAVPLMVKFRRAPSQAIQERPMLRTMRFDSTASLVEPQADRRWMVFAIAVVVITMLIVLGLALA